MNDLPHAQGPEKSVISTLLKDPAKLDDAPHLTPEHFHLPTTRGIFEAILRARDAGETVELIALNQRLHESGHLEEIGGTAALSDCYTYAATPLHFGQHLRMLTEKLTLRQALAMGREIVAAVEGGQDPGEVLDLVTGRASSLSDTLSESRPVEDTKALLRDSALRWEELAAGRENPMGIETSLAEINQLFRGLNPRRVTVISALPSHGKSLLGGQFFMDAVSAGVRGLFLTWEMTRQELMARLVAYEAKLPIDAVEDPVKFAREVEQKDRPTKETLQRLQHAYRSLAGYNFEIRGMHGQNISQAAAVIRREHRKGKLGIVVLDFIQRIGGARQLEKQSYERQLADIADRFQNLALELGFHGIVLSQLNKEGGPKYAEAINESCALHLKIVRVPLLGRDGTPAVDSSGDELIKARGLGVMKDRFHGQTGRLLKIGLNKATQRFERIHDETAQRT